MQNAKLLKTVKFYLGSTVILYALIAFALFSLGDTSLLFFVALVAVPVTAFAIVLLVIALVILAKTAKARPEFYTLGVLGGIAAVFYPIIALATASVCSRLLWFQPSFEAVAAWILNPFSAGFGLLVFHTIIISRAKRLLSR